MGVTHVKSTPITNLDATPIIYSNAGIGAPGALVSVSATITPAASDSTGSTYAMCRVPTSAILKHVWFTGQAQSAGTFDVSVYYSDSTTDGTAVANQGVVVPTTGATFIADAIVNASAVAMTEVLGYGGTAAGWDPSMINKKLWDALGLTTDPGGFFDIYLVCTDTAVTTGTGKVMLAVEYVVD